MEQLTSVRRSKLHLKTFALMGMALLIFLAGCQKKEEPKGQAPGPSTPMYSESELKLLREAANQDPKNEAAWIRLGNASMDSHLYQDAIDAYQKALDLNPKDVDVRVDMGTCFRNVGQFDRAVEEYKRAIEIDPRHINAHRNLGIVLGYDLGRKEEAIKELEESLVLAPAGPAAESTRKAIEGLKRR